MKNLPAFLRDNNKELDQRMQRALEMCASRRFTDAHLFMALYHLNSISAQFLEIDESLINIADQYRVQPRVPLNEIELLPSESGAAEAVFIRVLEDLGEAKTLGVRNFLRSVLAQILEKGDDYDARPYTADVLVASAGYAQHLEISKARGVRELVQKLARMPTEDEDFQYILSFENDRIAFRVVSTLGDYIQTSDTGLYVAQRALLTHFKDRFGGFTSDEIEELEELVNSTKASEREYQRYFERHPHFLRRWDYREIYPQVYLSRRDFGPLIPDFILTDRETQRAAIIDLKLSKPKLIRRQANRERFSASLSEARAQLLQYRDWFRDQDSRRMLKAKVGMEIYEPHLAVIIGRSSEFQDEFDRQRLAADSDIEVVTYDDMINFAKRRQVIISRGSHP